MGYRLIILNGGGRGERLELVAGELTLDSRGIVPAGAVGHPGALQVLLHVTGQELHATSSATGMLINDSARDTALLRHGDVLQLEGTRYFVQSFEPGKELSAATPARTRLTWLRLSLGVGVALLAWFIAGPRLHLAPTTPPPLPHPPTNAPLPELSPIVFDDCQITNLPRIAIHPDVSLTSSPPDITEALASFRELRPDQTTAEVMAASQELAAATRFLADLGELTVTAHAVTNREAGHQELERAAIYLNTAEAPPSASAVTIPATSSPTPQGGHDAGSK